MYNRIRNFSCCLFAGLFLVMILLPAGCNDNKNYRPSRASAKKVRRENEQARKEFEAELQKTMEQTEAMLKPYRKNGLLKVKLNPDGEVYIDEGLVTIPKKGLMLPVGTYEIKALWPDGKQATKKVFVTPAFQQLVSCKWEYSRNTSGGSGKQDSNIDIDAPLSPTVVSFTKP